MKQLKIERNLRKRIVAYLMTVVMLTSVFATMKVSNADDSGRVKSDTAYGLTVTQKSDGEAGIRVQGTVATGQHYLFSIEKGGTYEVTGTYGSESSVDVAYTQDQQYAEFPGVYKERGIIEVNTSEPVIIILNNATIYTRYIFNTPIVVNDKGLNATNVTIDIKGNNKLASINSVSTSAILKQDGDNSGKLTFTGDGTLELISSGPCIGAPLARTIPVKDYNCTNITFSHTGTINATSTKSYTVIGANDSAGNGTNRYVSNIFVNSGTLNLTTGTEGMGGAIGTTGNDAYCGGIYVNGGRINVTSEASKDDHYILGSLKNYNIIGVYGGLLTANNDMACMNYTKAGIYPVQIDDSLSSISDIELEVSGTTYDLSASKQITSEGKLKFYLPKGIAKVKVNGTVYWGTITGSMDTLTLSKLDSFVPVTSISGIPSEISAGKTYTLSGTVNPSSAVDKTISYEIVDAGTTGATLNKNVLNTTDSGTLKIRATIRYGSADMTPYTQDFTITAKYVPVTDIDGTVPVNADVLDIITLPTNVKPSDATKNSVVWSIDSENNTANATLAGNKLSFEKEGSVKIKATVQNGTSTTEDYEKTYEISVVYNNVTGISIDKTSIDPGADVEITATVLPATGKYSSIEWEVLPSDNSAEGKVKSYNGKKVIVNATNAGSFKLSAKVMGYGDNIGNVDYEETFVINVTSQMTYDLKKGPITIVRYDDNHNTITYTKADGTQVSDVISKDEQIVVTATANISADEKHIIVVGNGTDATEAHIALKNITTYYTCNDPAVEINKAGLIWVNNKAEAYVSAIGDNKAIPKETSSYVLGSAILVSKGGHLILEENVNNGKLTFSAENGVALRSSDPFIGGDSEAGMIDITGGKWEFYTGTGSGENQIIGTSGTLDGINISGGTIKINAPRLNGTYIGFGATGKAENTTINFTGGRIETTANEQGGTIFGAGPGLEGVLNINISGGSIYSAYAKYAIIGRTQAGNADGIININISGGEIIYRGGSFTNYYPIIGSAPNDEGISNINLKISGGIIDINTATGSAVQIGEALPRDELKSNIDISGGTIKASIRGDDVKISGGTIIGDVVGTPKNTSGNYVFKTEVDLSGVLGANTKLKETDNIITQSSDYTYGFKDVYTNSAGKLYIYLPADSSVVSTTAKICSTNNNLKVSLTGSVKQDGTGKLAPANQYKITVTQANIGYGEALPDPEYTVKNGGADVTIDTSKLAITYTGTSDTSYTESTTKPTECGSYIVKVTYADDAGCGSSQATFTIDKKSISSVTVNGLDDAQYTGTVVEPDLEVWDGDTKLTKGVDYTVTYANNTDIGTADVTITGKGNYKDTVTKHFNIVKLISNVTVASIADQYYTGGAIEPVVTVTDGTTLSLGVDYTVSYDNNYDIGTATVTITGIGNYSGSVTKNFVIKYVDAPTGYISGTAGDNGWYTDTVIISKDDWMVSLDAENWKSYIVIDTEGTTNKTIYFKNSDEQITDGVNVSVKIDKTSPSFTAVNNGIKFGNHIWNQLINSVKFEILSSADDMIFVGTDGGNGSGVAGYYYYIDAVADTSNYTVKTASELDDLVFTKTTGPLTLNVDQSQVVYAYVKDNAGRKSAYICSDGIVIDNTAPTLTLTAPATSDITDKAASAKVSSSEDSKIYYVLSTSENPSITKDNIVSAANFNNSVKNATASTDITLDYSNLAEGTTYHIYAVAEDAVGNRSAIKHISFTTKSNGYVSKLPTLTGVYGTDLNGLTLTDGEILTAADGTKINGTFTLTDSAKSESPAVVPTVGTLGTYEVTFTPDASYGGQYLPRTFMVKPTIEKAEVNIVTKPTAATITYGDSLGDSILDANSASVTAVVGGSSVEIAGTWSWKSPDTKPSAADSDVTAYEITFTPTDTTNFKAKDTTVTITVNKQADAPNMPSATMNPAYTIEKISDITLPADWSFNSSDLATELEVGVSVTATANYTGSDAGNYENEQRVITITRSACEHPDANQSTINASSATCTAKGYSGDTYCSQCDQIAEYGHDIEALGHNYELIDVVQPSFEAAGSKTYECSRCHDTYTEPVDKLKAGVPFDENDPSTSGWELITNKIEASTGEATIVINMNGIIKVPGKVFEEAKGKDVTLVFEMGNDIKWTVNGNDITSDSIGEINLGVTTGANAGKNIPVDVINEITGERYSMNLTLAYDGQFGFKAVLTVNLEPKNKDLIANLFYYNPSTNKLEYVCASKIDAAGNADLTFTHASDYTIVISDKDMKDNPNKAPITEPKTGDPFDTRVWFLLVLSGMGLLGIELKRKRR